MAFRAGSVREWRAEGEREREPKEGPKEGQRDVTYLQSRIFPPFFPPFFFLGSVVTVSTSQRHSASATADRLCICQPAENNERGEAEQHTGVKTKKWQL